MENNSEQLQKKSSVVVNAQYIKDLSFENPKSPMSLMLEEQPQMDVSLDILVTPLEPLIFEVVLSIEVRSSAKGSDLFIIDLHYGGVFTLEAENDAEKELTLLVYCPSILFPYARRIISDVSRDGGFPPLMISPIDFMGLYSQKKANEAVPNKEEESKVIN
ncbi:protein-export chaperone SecB [Holosporaceae bacterium 'Namur']|nr:protein-export chaperone SecB [Holosporaceae bacterium 'Namur']